MEMYDVPQRQPWFLNMSKKERSVPKLSLLVCFPLAGLGVGRIVSVGKERRRNERQDRTDEKRVGG